MYLVIIKKFQSDLNERPYYTFQIEHLQSIDYQLMSKDWSVIDCVPVKGGGFEVHFGGEHSDVNSSDGFEYRVKAVALCPDSERAIEMAANLSDFVSHIDDYDTDRSPCAAPKNCLYMYIDNMVMADNPVIA